jgi:hypothetical protein
MKTNYLKPGELIVPLGLLAFIGPGISFIGGVLNTTTRWGILAALSFYLLFYRVRDVRGVLSHPLFQTVLVYGLWGLMTVAWSELPQISFYKSLVFIWLSATMLIAGYFWVMRHDQAQSFDLLWLTAVFALFASPAGQLEQNWDTGSVVYAGRTGNPNFLGFVLATASVWLLWRAYLAYRQKHRSYILFSGLLAVNLYYLFLSHSRASLLIMVVVSLGLLLGLRKFMKWQPYILVVAALLGTAYNATPAVHDFVTQYTFKSDLYLRDAGGNIWFSRAEIWRESYDRAVQGGMWGAGYGVTIGEKFYGEIGSTISSGQYGREHGNSQLAIVEQTGMVGLALYLMLLAGIFNVWLVGLRIAGDEADRVAIGLLGGAVLGLLVHSVFESWWTAPGAAESATFWILLGALVGVTQRARMKVRLSRESMRVQVQPSAAWQLPRRVRP